MEYVSAVVDECGDVLYYVYEIGWHKAQELVGSHPEWSIRTILV